MESGITTTLETAKQDDVLVKLYRNHLSRQGFKTWFPNPEHEIEAAKSWEANQKAGK